MDKSILNVKTKNLFVTTDDDIYKTIIASAKCTSAFTMVS